MSPRPADRFPYEAVRDLLGVVRALYAAAKQDGAGKVHLRRITTVGQKLSSALDIATDSRPGSRAHDAALRRAEEATRQVGDLVDVLTPAEPLVGAARKRVVTPRGAAWRPRKPRDER